MPNDLKSPQHYLLKKLHTPRACAGLFLVRTNCNSYQTSSAGLSTFLFFLFFFFKNNFQNLFVSTAVDGHYFKPKCKLDHTWSLAGAIGRVLVHVQVVFIPLADSIKPSLHFIPLMYFFLPKSRVLKVICLSQSLLSQATIKCLPVFHFSAFC